MILENLFFECTPGLFLLGLGRNVLVVLTLDLAIDLDLDLNLDLDLFLFPFCGKVSIKKNYFVAYLIH